jgi:hypothetical protein
MSGTPQPPTPAHPAYVVWVDQRLSDRDRAILATLARVRLATGGQLERLHFHDLSITARAPVRRRVLARLAAWKVLAALPRRVGGVRAGSTGLIFTLDTTGHHLTAPHDQSRATRRPRPVGEAFTTHTLAITELYVRIVELSHAGHVLLEEFCSESAAWVPNGRGGWLKPDAYLILSNGAVDDHWWVEVDRATEHLPAIRRKASMYLDYLHRGPRDPRDVMPCVLFTVPNQKRRDDITKMIASLPEPAPALFHITHQDDAAEFLITKLRE